MKMLDLNEFCGYYIQIVVRFEPHTLNRLYFNKMKFLQQGFVWTPPLPFLCNTNWSQVWSWVSEMELCCLANRQTDRLAHTISTLCFSL